MHVQVKFSNYRSKKRCENDFKHDGINYKSKLEARIAQDLDYRKEKGEILSWEQSVKYEFNLYENPTGEWVLTNDTKLQLKSANKKFLHVTNYYLDFEACRADGVTELIEGKGIKFNVGMQKWSFLEAIYGTNPAFELIMVKD